MVLGANEVLIPLKRKTRDALKILCEKENRSYDSLIREMIELYEGEDPFSPL